MRKINLNKFKPSDALRQQIASDVDSLKQEVLVALAVEAKKELRSRIPDIKLDEQPKLPVGYIISHVGAGDFKPQVFESVRDHLANNAGDILRRSGIKLESGSE